MAGSMASACTWAHSPFYAVVGARNRCLQAPEQSCARRTPAPHRCCVAPSLHLMLLQVTAAPCLGFIGFLCSKAQAALERLHLAGARQLALFGVQLPLALPSTTAPARTTTTLAAGSSLLWAAFWACFALPTVALARLLLEFTSSSLTAWNALALVHTFGEAVFPLATLAAALGGTAPARQRVHPPASHAQRSARRKWPSSACCSTDSSVSPTR